MSEVRDPAIKLFGKTIPLPEPGEAPADPPPAEESGDGEKDVCNEVTNNEVKEMVLDAPGEGAQVEQMSSSSLNNENEDGHQASNEDVKEIDDPKHEQDQTDADISGQEKVLKKPDKILPCPRCNSMDTKFCYYNNYNVNQPRHFCKNCQRYWTAGGTMRNVPVGAGRRKNKHSASHYRHIMMSSDGLASARVDTPDSCHPQALTCGSSAPMRPLKVNGTVLKFGHETPLCESMASVLNLGEQKKNAELGTATCAENREEPSCASSVTASNCAENVSSEKATHMEKNGMQGFCNGLTPMHPLQCFPGPPWAYPWNPGWNSAAAVSAMAAGQCSSELFYGPENSNPSPIPWNPPPMVAAPAFCAPTIPIPLVPASFWGSWTGGVWSVPWVGSNGGISPSSSSNSGCSGNGSPTLGKHSRDASLPGEEKTEKSLWVPKTLRIDDPDEAAKSSIWATLGIKPEEGGIFKAFHSKVESKVKTSGAAPLLHANPAALSRSQSFQEAT